MAKTKKDEGEQPGIQPDIQMEEAQAQEEHVPQAFIEDYNIQDAALNELKMLAKTSGPKGPDARPGRFGPRHQGTVHRIDSNVRVEDAEAEERRMATVSLFQSYVKKTILSGRVFGVRRVFDRSQKGKYRYFAVVKNGPYQVFIPSDKFTDIDMEELAKVYQRNDPNKTVEDATKIYLESRLDAVIDYIVTNLPESGDLDETAFVGGSRAEAMRRKRIQFWFGKHPDGQYKMQVGDIAEARIIAVARNGIRIEIYGVETFIQSRELAWNMIQNAADEFNTGDKIEVKITDIRRNIDNDYAVEFDASVKQAKPDPRINGMRMFSEGGVYSGIINFIRVPDADNPNVRPAVFVKLDEGVQCMCPFPFGSVPPKQGARVFVRITNHNEERKFLFGTITHIRNSY